MTPITLIDMAVGITGYWHDKRRNPFPNLASPALGVCGVFEKPHDPFGLYLSKRAGTDFSWSYRYTLNLFDSHITTIRISGFLSCVFLSVSRSVSEARQLL